MLYKLYLDESGTPDPDNKSFPYFILSGLIVEKDQSDKLKIAADRIKFKYWGNNFSQIVFHSREIGRRENNFSILKDPNIEQPFQRDLFNFLNLSGIKCIIIAVDKRKAKIQKWDTKAIYNNSSSKLLEFFIEFLATKKEKGQIIIESAGTQKDILFYTRYIHYLANGMSSLKITHQKMKTILTSISFVSKNNHDIETQIADLLAYPAGHQCVASDGIKKMILNSYEDKMCQILNNKIIQINSKSSFINLL